MSVRLLCSVIGCALACAAPVQAQVKLSQLKGGVYQQNFDQLPAPTEQTPWSWANDGKQSRYGMDGWFIATLANSAKPLASESSYLSVAGKNPNAVSAVNYGTAGGTDRAVGFRMSIKAEHNSKHRFFAGVVFVNDTKTPIARVTISYTGEQWSKAGPDPEAVQTLRVAIANLGPKFDPAKFAVHTVAPVAEVGSLTFSSSPAITGNSRYGTNGPLHRAELASAIAFPRALAPGEHFLVLWLASGNGVENGAHALALDDVRVEFEPAK